MTHTNLETGSRVPDFSAESTEGTIRMEDLLGRKLVLYFYPKDNTPGCNKEACAFRDANDVMTELGVEIIGVSKDSLKRHHGFKEKFGLNFPLISDPDGKLIEAFGAWKKKSMYGKTFMGIDRSTFLIDEEGLIRHIWRKVKVGGHSEAVLEAVRSL
jgi:thioredoxin-dependent peroxiredoxin